MSIPPLDPPRPIAPGGHGRRVGVEVELGDIPASAMAEAVQARFGGALVELDPHLFEVRGARYGTWLTKLDTRYAHQAARQRIDPADPQSAPNQILHDIAQVTDKVVADVMQVWMPTELVAPPVPYGALPLLDGLLMDMQAQGATGTRASPLYAFGVHLNVEIATAEADWLLAVLRAYVLCSDWLRSLIRVDLARRMVPYVDPFPDDYVARILDPAYAPDLDGLIADYLADNPTRNREVDLLPLFAWLAPDQVAAATTDERVRGRPVFHYRLPNADPEDGEWSLVGEWNRMMAVERLAEDPQRLSAMAAAWLDGHHRGRRSAWPEDCREWLPAGA